MGAPGRALLPHAAGVGASQATYPRKLWEESAADKPRIDTSTPHTTRHSPSALLAEQGCVCASRRGGEPLPVPLGDDFDGAIHDLDGGLIVDHLGRTGDIGRPAFR